MKQLPYGVPTNIRYNCTKLSCLGDLANGICVPQVITKNTSAFSNPLTKLCCGTTQFQITACEYIYNAGHTALSHVDNELQTLQQQQHQYLYILSYKLYRKLTTAKRDDAGSSTAVCGDVISQQSKY